MTASVGRRKKLILKNNAWHGEIWRSGRRYRRLQQTSSTNLVIWRRCVKRRRMAEHGGQAGGAETATGSTCGKKHETA